MSTYYYLHCKEHDQSCAIARRGFSSMGPLVGDEKRFDFLSAHVGCDIRVVDEHRLNQVEPKSPHPGIEIRVEVWGQQDQRFWLTPEFLLHGIGAEKYAADLVIKALKEVKRNL